MECPKIIKSPFYLQSRILSFIILFIIYILIYLISLFKLDFNQIRSLTKIFFNIFQSLYLNLLWINNLSKFILCNCFQSLTSIFLQFLSWVSRILLVFNTTHLRCFFLFFSCILIFERHHLFIVKINKSIIKIIDQILFFCRIHYIFIVRISFLMLG